MSYYDMEMFSLGGCEKNYYDMEMFSLGGIWEEWWLIPKVCKC